jgi:hypothetical protein
MIDAAAVDDANEDRDNFITYYLYNLVMVMCGLPEFVTRDRISND